MLSDRVIRASFVVMFDFWPWFQTPELLRPLESESSVSFCMPVNGWVSLDSFRMGAELQKNQIMIIRLEFSSPHSPSTFWRKRNWKTITIGQLNNQLYLYNETSIKTLNNEVWRTSDWWASRCWRITCLEGMGNLPYTSLPYGCYGVVTFVINQ